MSKLEQIFSLLRRFQLESYYNSFLELGVKVETDFTDIDGDNLTTLGLTQIEKNRFARMRTFIKPLPIGIFQIKYTFPKCSEPKEISDIDPSQNTLDDLMFRIGILENIGNDKAMCLYMACGVPLTDDPFFNTWSLKDRHIENGSELYAIFTPKENLRYAPQKTGPRVHHEIPGDDTVWCHIMLRSKRSRAVTSFELSFLARGVKPQSQRATGNYEIQLDLEQDKLGDLIRKLSKESAIPAHVLHVRNVKGGPGQSLKDLEISDQSAIHFSLSSFDCPSQDVKEFFMCDVNPLVRQTPKGMSTFFSTFYVMSKKSFGSNLHKVIALIGRLTSCNALAQAIYQLLCRAELGTRNQKIAIVEGLYLLFRELLPGRAKRTSPHIIEDNEVFEYSNVCWAYLISHSENEEDLVFAPISLCCEGSGEKLCEPVRVPGIPSVFDRAYVQDKIRSGEKIPCCSDDNLKETSIQRAIDIERFLLSLPLSRNLHLLVTSSSSCNFQFNSEQTFDEMTEGLAKYSHLQACPPLALLNLGVDPPGLLYVGKDNLGVYLDPVKRGTGNTVRDFLTGKDKKVDLHKLACELGDSRKQQTVHINRVPEEAILVLVDASSSMTETCYTSWKRMDAVKQLFDSFTDRTLAYNFHQVIGLIKFESDLKFHPFTESLETFRTHVRGLEPQGVTRLYDALNLGFLELLKVKLNFPNCRLRMLCLTDGDDIGSKYDPVEVAVNLIGANIVVDSILLGENTNNVLHGISNVTGGCCFKPETSKDALKLFEMETVLSLERRKLKRRHEASAVKSLADLTNLFQSCGFDQKPEVTYPEELSHKVTLPQNALKKKILESKTGRFMHKGGRILEELKQLHMEPHPYCTVLPSEEDIGFWKILMKGPPNTPYADGAFELYCQFGEDYPLKPPLVRFLTPIYHCNINSVGRICHNIFDKDYSAHVTMKEILEAVFGLLIVPEAEDPLDSILAEQFLSSREKYDEDAQKSTEQAAATTIADLEQKLVGEDTSQTNIPPHLICQLSKRMFVDPVITPQGHIYERRAIETELKKRKADPFSNEPLEVKDLRPNRDMTSMVRRYRESLIQGTAV